MSLPQSMTIKHVVSHVASAYQIDITNSGQLRPMERISRSTLEASFEYSKDFLHVCNRQFNLLLNF